MKWAYGQTINGRSFASPETLFVSVGGSWGKAFSRPVELLYLLTDRPKGISVSFPVRKVRKTHTEDFAVAHTAAQVAKQAAMQEAAQASAQASVQASAQASAQAAKLVEEAHADVKAACVATSAATATTSAVTNAASTATSAVTNAASTATSAAATGTSGSTTGSTTGSTATAASATSAATGTTSASATSAASTAAVASELGLSAGSRSLQPPRYRMSTPPGTPIISATNKRPAQSVFVRVLRAAFSVVFYSALIIAVLTAYQMSGSKGAPRIVLGYSAMTVLTGSMKPDIPKGSLIVNKQVDVGSIQVGDTITFMMNENTAVTHSVVAIYENYKNTGKRAFQTQGIANLAPDKEAVLAENVVGKVIFSSEKLGAAINFVMAHPVLVGIMFVLSIGLLTSLRVVFGKEDAGRAGAVSAGAGRVEAWRAGTRAR